MKLKLLGFVLILFPIFCQASFSILNEDKSNQTIFSSPPGGSDIKNITISNNGNVDLDLTITGSDALLNKNGITSYLQPADSKSIGQWLETPKTQVRVAANSSTTLPITLRIPSTATPGVYLGGLSVQVDNSQNNGNNTGAKAIPRVIHKVIANVNGTKKLDYQFSPLEFIGSPYDHFRFSFINRGNTLIQLNYQIQVRNLLTNRLSTIAPPPIYIAPDQKSELTNAWSDNSPLQEASIKLQVASFDPTLNRYEESHDYQQTIIFSRFSTLLSITLFGLIALTMIVWSIRHLYYHLLRHKSHPYKVKKDENLAGIAQKNQISWQLLARVNRLQKPYTLEENQIILLPIRSPKIHKSR